MRHLAIIGGGVAVIWALWELVKMKNIEWTARIAWGEARGEGLDGLHAVTNVIDNRARSSVSWWGGNHADVATAPFQFSAYNRNDPNRAKLEAVTDDDPLFVDALELAARAVAGRLTDITGGATHYHASSIVPPDWTNGATVTATIGSHIFYKDVA